MKNLNLPLVAVFLLGVLGCQSDNAPQSDPSLPTTFAHFRIELFQTDKKIKAEAAIGKAISENNAKPAKVDKGVIFQNRNMTEKDLGEFGIKYRFEYNDVFDDSYSFQFKDSLHGEIKHETSIYRIEDFSIEDGIINKSKGVTLKWVGAPMKENESLIVMINTNQKLNSLEIQGTTSVSEIEIPAERLNKLDEGEAKMYLVRKKGEQKNTPNFESFTETEFYTFEKTIIVKP